jgi:hypothetical protein
MSQEWQVLTQLTGSAPFVVERVRMKETGVTIEGAFEPPPLAQLSADDQIFVAAFVRCHGSIKTMETFFGVSYPTIKNRLNRIGALLPFVEVGVPPAPSTGELLGKLERGEVTVREVLAHLRPDHADHD